MGLTIRHLQQSRDQGQVLLAATATDFTLAGILDQAGLDLLLVGDSLAMVSLGYQTTLPVTPEEMLMVTRAVVRGVQRAVVIADLPFGSYEANPLQAWTTAIPFIKAGAQGVKVEGGYPTMLETITFLVTRGIPVLGHLGLTPQAVNQLGGFRQQAKTPETADHLLQQALAVEAAGAFALVLEHIPSAVAQAVTAKLTIPTLGIGAGPATSGQIYVTHDLLGLTAKQPPFSQPILPLRDMIHGALTQLRKDTSAPNSAKLD
jgi:3-methyl-2-oxobutanoate hydroxymethyltransferase